MKHLFIIMSVLLIAIIPCLSQAKDLWPVISANGFFCSSDGGVISCKGSFPDHPLPLLTVHGMYSVTIMSEYVGYRWNYNSDSGCLCKTVVPPKGIPKSSNCKSARGREKAFSTKSGFDGSLARWCESADKTP